MPKRYSIAEARQNLAAIVHELERRSPIELTRRGEPVAVMLSFREYQQLSSSQPGFWDAYEAFRKQVDLQALAITGDVLGDVRDRSSGRDVEL